MKDKKNLLIFSIVSIPIAWAGLQFYHLILTGPIINWIIGTFPGQLESFPMPYPFVASLLNLTIFGTAAAIWPNLGFGESWKPDRRQSLVVLLLIGLSVIYPIFHIGFGNVNPIKKMGFVTWTITPVQEEIIFRGFIYSLLLRLLKKSDNLPLREIMPVILLGAIWFSLWHLSPHAIGKYGWGFMTVQLVLTFGAGIIFNVLRYWTRSIWLIMPVHAAGNFMFNMI